MVCAVEFGVPDLPCESTLLGVGVVPIPPATAVDDDEGLAGPPLTALYVGRFGDAAPVFTIVVGVPIEVSM